MGVAVADFNEDGAPDLAESEPAGVVTVMGNGDGTFQPATFYGLGTFGPTPIAVGDFTGDGKVDVFVNVHHLEPTEFNGLLLAGHGDGTFETLGTGVSLNGSGSVSVADFNGDGRLDLVQVPGAYSQGAAILGVWAGNENGTFQTPPITLTAGSNPSYSVGVDLNGDKSPDIVVTNTGDNTVSVLLNTVHVGADFSISASAPAPSTVGPGQSATSTVSLSSLNTFDNPVSLNCLVQPAQTSSPTCSVHPDLVTFDANGNATATVTITTGTAIASLVPLLLRHDLRSLQMLGPIAAFAMVGMGLGSRLSGRRKQKPLLLGFVLVGALILQAACVGSGSPGSTTYTITVTGKSASTQHSTTTTLTVE